MPKTDRTPDLELTIRHPLYDELSKAKIFYTDNPDDPASYSFDYPSETYIITGGKTSVAKLLDILNTDTEFTKVDELTETIDLGNPPITADPVLHPSHYADGSIECIDAIRASMTPDEFAGYCKGNCEKYIWRFSKKNGVEDLEKAKVYLTWLINTLKGEKLTK